MNSEFEGDYWNNRFYDSSEQRFLKLQDACPYDEWIKGNKEAKFAIHPQGFAIFLDSSEIASSDEYEEEDPYGVQEGLIKYGPFQQRRFKFTIDLIKKALEKKDSSTIRILDLGCGEGHITAEIAKEFPAVNVSGLDYSISAVTDAHESFKNIDFIVADAYAPPYPSEHFDVVVLNNIWEHVPDPLRLLKSIKRILVPGGHVIISTPSRYRLRNLVRILFGKPVVFMSKHHVTEYSVGQVIEQLSFMGFDTKVYSDRLRGPAGGLMRFIAFKMAIPVLNLFLRLVRSHHSLEETVFYLGKKT